MLSLICYMAFGSYCTFSTAIKGGRLDQCFLFICDYESYFQNKVLFSTLFQFFSSYLELGSIWC